MSIAASVRAEHTAPAAAGVSTKPRGSEKRLRYLLWVGSRCSAPLPAGAVWPAAADKTLVGDGTPVVSSTGARFGLNLIPAVGAQGQLHFMLTNGRVTAAVFMDFLKRLLVDARTLSRRRGHPLAGAGIDYQHEHQQGRAPCTDGRRGSCAGQLHADFDGWHHIARRGAALPGEGWGCYPVTLGSQQPGARRQARSLCSSHCRCS